MTTGRAVLEALPAVPAGPELLSAAAGLPGIHLVGGAVRDLLRGQTPRELDVVVDGDPARLLERLAAGSSATSDTTLHPRFETATVTTATGRIDVARARRERYPAPGALPEVEPAPLAEDLGRRDFTVNAIAVALADGLVQAAPHAVSDLEHRTLRVLHDRSFTDDPTRLLRLARYQTRLGFTVDPHTAELAAAASLDGVSGTRIGAELRRALGEPDPLAVLAASRGLPVVVDDRLARRASDLLPAGSRVDLMIFAIATRGIATLPWLESLGFPARERDVVVAAWDAGRLAQAAADAGSASALYAALAGAPLEAVAVAGALGAPVGRFLDELRHVGLEIDGDDLAAAGLDGPEIGRRLRRTLARKLDGELAGRAAELASALA